MKSIKEMSEEELKKNLTTEQYYVMREKGTEPAFSSSVLTNNEKGMYVCAACGHELFSSDAKFKLPEWDPNAGWPSFDSVANKENIELKPDDSHGMHRAEVLCKNCGSHLGHLFDDGPRDPSTGSGQATGEHYCINGCTLEFKKK